MCVFCILLLFFFLRRGSNFMVLEKTTTQVWMKIIPPYHCNVGDHSIALRNELFHFLRIVWEWDQKSQFIRDQKSQFTVVHPSLSILSCQHNSILPGPVLSHSSLLFSYRLPFFISLLVFLQRRN